MNSSNATSLIQVSIDSEGIALIKLNRPEKRNALSQQLIDALVSTIARVDCDEKVRVIVLTGSNPAGPFSGIYPGSCLITRLGTGGFSLFVFCYDFTSVSIKHGLGDILRMASFFAPRSNLLRCAHGHIALKFASKLRIQQLHFLYLSVPPLQLHS